MKTLRIVLASALIILSFNAFSETCNPCVASGNLREDSVMLYDGNSSHDTNVSDVLQQMTATVNQQILNTTAAGQTKKHNHNKKKARS